MMADKAREILDVKEASGFGEWLKRNRNPLHPRTRTTSRSELN